MIMPAIVINFRKVYGVEEIVVIPIQSAVRLHVASRKSYTLSHEYFPGIENQHGKCRSVGIGVTVPIRLGLPYAFDTILRGGAWPEIQTPEAMRRMTVLDHRRARDIGLSMRY